jgi:hypothetical protein
MAETKQQRQHGAGHGVSEGSVARGTRRGPGGPPAIAERGKRTEDLAIEWWPVERLKPYERNARKMPERAIDKVAASVREFGWRQPIVVDGSETIVVGHVRHRAAQKLGLALVPVHVAADLTPAQIRAYRLADNRAAQETSWDDELLALEFADLKALDIDLSLTGFDPAEIAPLAKDEMTADPDLERADELQQKWKCALGQVWTVGRHRVMCGNSGDPDDVKTLTAGLSPDLICTDPPYELNASSVRAAFELLGDRAIVMAGDKLAFDLARLWKFRIDMIWHHRKPKKVPTLNLPLIFHAHLVVLTKSGDVPSGWRKPRPDFGSVISTEQEYEDDRMGHGKAVEVFCRMLEGFTWKRIADPFLGTGASLLAAERLGRQLIGMEIQPSTLAVALERLELSGLRPVLAD